LFRDTSEIILSSSLFDMLVLTSLCCLLVC